MSTRDYNDPLYKAFRKAVRNRDCYCRWPLCYARKKLQVHHIIKWADNAALRYLPENGITLCKKHHTFIKGKEEFYAPMLIGLIKR